MAKIDQELCIGCESCVPVCTVGAIHMGEDGKAHVDLDACVECGVCVRSEVCPVNAIYMPRLEYPRILRNYFSDPTATHKLTGIPGRGTEEVKTNDVTLRYDWGYYGLCIELGRPGVGTSFRDVEKVTMSLARLGVEFVEKNPIISLFEDVKTGKLKEEVLDERVLSIIVEVRVPEDRIFEVLEELRRLEEQVETVFTVGVISRIKPDGQVPILEELKRKGFQVRPNAKVNVGLGRRLVEVGTR